MAVVVKTRAGLVGKHGGRCLLRSVRTAESQQTGLRDRHLNRAFRQKMNRGAAAMDNMRNKIEFFEH